MDSDFADQVPLSLFQPDTENWRGTKDCEEQRECKLDLFGMFYRADKESGAVEVAQLIHNKEALKHAKDYAVKLRRVGLVNKLDKLWLKEQLDGQENDIRVIRMRHFFL